MNFQKDESVIPAKWKKSGDTLTISIASGLAKTAGRKAREPPKKQAYDLKGINRSGTASKGKLCGFHIKNIRYQIYFDFLDFNLLFFF